MEMQLGGQVVVVIGGARGIGAAISEAFAQEQAQVAILDVVSEVHETAAALQERYGVRTLGLSVDATDYAAVQAAAVRIEAELGVWNHLVYAAGVGSGKVGFPFWNLEPSDWDRVLRVNLLGVVNAAHTFAPALARAGQGTMLFLASIAGQIGSQTDPPYSAAKQASSILRSVRHATSPGMEFASIPSAPVWSRPP